MEYYYHMLANEQDKYNQGYYDAPDEDEDEVDLEWLDEDDVESILGMDAQEYTWELEDIPIEHF